MHIQQSEIQMASSHRLVQEHEYSVRLTQGVMNDEGQLVGPGRSQESSAAFRSLLDEEMTEAPGWREPLEALGVGNVGVTEDGELVETDAAIDPGARLRSLFDTLKTMMTGYLLRLLEGGGDHRPMGDLCNSEDAEDVADQAMDAICGVAGAEGGVSKTRGVGSEGGELDLPRLRSRLDFKHRIYEEETTTFTANGQVKTADGRSFDLAVDVGMSRQEARSVEMSMVMDPLVIQFDGRASELGEVLTDFDLDEDGTHDAFRSLAPGSGWLTCDWNEDGTVSGGSELFGTESGNGFADLAAYDEDGNGWIDEGDAIYDRLSIWHWDREGEDALESVRELELGAFYLGATSTEFRLVQGGETAGHIRASGIGLKEEGSPFTIQQIDLSMA
ncbi:MAG: hypothetical protein ACYTGH_03235 [Planctomycetota bacterium]|jgi:hypothetical protein